jgi:AbrB family looped-hinge helix DNA binding protein
MEMVRTRLSSKGQVIIPKALRDAYNWRPGQEFVVIDTGDGLMLKVSRPFKETRLEDVAGILQYDGPPKSLEEMEQAIEKGVKEMVRDRR